MKLYEKFLKEVNLENANIVEKALACGCLRAVVVDPHNKPMYDTFENADFFPDECKSVTGLTSLVTTFDYYSNDLACILADSIRKDKIESPLSENVTKTFDFIFNYLANLLTSGKYIVFKLGTGYAQTETTSCYRAYKGCFKSDGTLDVDYLSEYGECLARDNAEQYGIYDDEDGEVEGNSISYEYELVEFNSDDEVIELYGEVLEF